MMSLYKYYTSACGSNNGNFLRELGFKYVDNLKDADVVIFGGGSDIDPATYGEEPSGRTYPNKIRESQEKADFREGLKLGKKFFGICRGHQLLCAMAGGKLIQDVQGHGGDHYIMTFDEVRCKTNSIHHQMINPYTIKNPSDYRILAWSDKRRSGRYVGAKDKPVLLPWDFREIEAIIFPKINAFGVQYHPEMLYGAGKQYDGVMTWTQNTFMKFFNNKEI